MGDQVAGFSRAPAGFGYLRNESANEVLSLSPLSLYMCLTLRWKGFKDEMTNVLMAHCAHRPKLLKFCAALKSDKKEACSALGDSCSVATGKVLSYPGESCSSFCLHPFNPHWYRSNEAKPKTAPQQRFLLSQKWKQKESSFFLTLACLSSLPLPHLSLSSFLSLPLPHLQHEEILIFSDAEQRLSWKIWACQQGRGQ